MSESTSARAQIKQRFVAVGERLVHYRTCGEGPPALLLHDSVKSSVALVPLAQRLSHSYRVFALDSPGCGNSDALPGRPQIIDLARAVRDTMDALGLEKVFIYGRHTSSKVVLELLAHWPERFVVGVMDGLSLSDPAPSEQFVSRYLPEIQIDDRGAYLAGAWTLIADMTRWFPWFSKIGTARMRAPRRDAVAGHRFALDFLMAGEHYAGAYGAGLRYSGGARSIAALAPDAPAVFMAAKDDVLFPFLDKLPAERVKEFVSTTAEVPACVEQIFMRHLHAGQPASVPKQPESRQYLDCAHGQLHVRVLGARRQRSTLFLHELPGGAAAALPFLHALSAHDRAIAPDLPGGGDSDPLPVDQVSAGDYAQVLAEMLVSLGETKVNVIAQTTATPLAIAFVTRYPQLVESLILDGLVEQDEEMAVKFCPPIEYEPSGAHLHRLWHQLRDQQAQWPWYDGSVAAIRKVDADMSGRSLHARLLDVLKQVHHYGDATRAAFRFDSAQGLRELQCPLMVLTQEGDPLGACAQGLVALDLIHERAIGREARVAQVVAFFAEH